MRRRGTPSRASRKPNRLARRVAALPGRRFTFGPGLHADDPGPPPRITHGCEFMIHPNGWTEFHSDTLDDHWTVDGEEVRARHYLDIREPPKVQVFVPFERFRGGPHGVIDLTRTADILAEDDRVAFERAKRSE